MGTEYGIFNDEGCIEDGFYDLPAAEKAAQAYRDEGNDDAHAAEVCHDHPQHEREGCELCNDDEEEAEDEGEEEGLGR